MSERDQNDFFYIFFKETNQHNPYLDPIIEHINQIEEVHRSIHLNRPIQLTNLLPNDLEYFYRYYGSYTTPGCQETVTWIIFPQPLNIGYKQMDKFRQFLFNSLHRRDSDSNHNHHHHQHQQHQSYHQDHDHYHPQDYNQPEQESRQQNHFHHKILPKSANHLSYETKNYDNDGVYDDEKFKQTAINNVAEKAKEKEEKEKDQEEDDEDEADEGEIGFYRKIQNLGSRQICAPLRASSISMMRSSKLTVIIVVCVGLFLVSIFFRYGIRMEKKTKLFFCDIRI